MAVYKVLQDIEAEDKFVGPLTLKQFIYGCIAALCVYLSFFTLTRGIWFIALMLFPVIALAGFLAWPWSRDQPTEVWLLAKIRFFFKPRRRIWDQSGLSENVTITAPKKVEKHLTKDLTQTEVSSRLKALASTIDSRGWAVKNVNVNLYAEPSYGEADSDRLVGLSELPKEVSTLDITASDDVLDELSNPTAQHLQQLMNASNQVHFEQIRQTMEPSKFKKDKETRPDYWFMDLPDRQAGQPDKTKLNTKLATFKVQTIPPDATPSQTEAVIPTASEIELFKEIQHNREKMAGSSYGHTAVIQPMGSHKKGVTKSKKTVAKTVPPAPDPAIINLANNDDLNVATIAREANRAKGTDNGEVVINLR